MKECTRHRDAVVRYGPWHSECPLCVLQKRIDDLVPPHCPLPGDACPMTYVDGDSVREIKRESAEIG